MAAKTAWRGPALGGLTGVLYFVSFPPFGLVPLAWVALVPLLVAVRQSRSARQAGLAGAAAAMAVCLGGYFWIADTAHRFWQVPWPVAVVLLALFGTFGALHFTLFALLEWRWARLGAGTRAVRAAALFTACEIATPRIFPDKLGASQVDAGPLAAAAALVGAHGLTFLLVLVAASLAEAIRRESAWRGRAIVGLAVGATATIGLVAWGGAHRRALAALPGTKSLDVAVVQANIGDPEELAAALGNITQAIDSTVSTHLLLSSASLASRPADLVVWPETAVPSVPRPRVLERLQVLAVTHAVAIVYGSYDAERRDGRLQLYNAAFHMTPAGEVQGRYAKHKLLLFGEYVPLSTRFPKLLEILPTPGEFTPGAGPEIFRVGDVALAPLICYELLFPGVVRGALRAGGEVIVNLTNDYWFGKHLEPHQHLHLCRMAALEVARPIVRATNTGMSAIVDPGGRVLARTGIWTPEVLRATVSVPATHWTPYARWGERTLGVFVAACWIAIWFGSRLVRPSERRT